MSEYLGRELEAEQQLLLADAEALTERLNGLKQNFQGYDVSQVTDRAFKQVLTGANTDSLKQDLSDLISSQEKPAQRFIQLDRARAFLEHLKNRFPEVEDELYRNTLKPQINDLDGFIREEFAVAECPVTSG
jgi:BMFP domain-containing protein YqiC